jgi:hypothetical protein
LQDHDEVFDLYFTFITRAEFPSGIPTLLSAHERKYQLAACEHLLCGAIAHVFRIDGHPKARKAYAWSSPIEGSDKRRFFAVLHLPPVASPAEAVRAAIVQERRVGGHNGEA